MTPRSGASPHSAGTTDASRVLSSARRGRWEPVANPRRGSGCSRRRSPARTVPPTSSPVPWSKCCAKRLGLPSLHRHRTARRDARSGATSHRVKNPAETGSGDPRRTRPARLPRAELMDDPEQVRAYSEADFSEAHDAFVAHGLACFGPIAGEVLDLGCGAADPTVRFARANPDARIVGVDARPTCSLWPARGSAAPGWTIGS